MNILPIGIGQAGGRLTDALVQRGKESSIWWKPGEGSLKIIEAAFAVNTDEADMRSLKHIKKKQRIIYGEGETHGHGVGGDNKLGAKIAREGGDKIINAIKSVKNLYKVDAFLVVAGTAGGTGSGGMPVIIKTLKERFYDKPTYALAILPFNSQENTQESSVLNTATCLKATSQVADATILVDNELFKLKKNSSLLESLGWINSMVTQFFYDLLRAGEERSRGRIGGKTVDAGDIQRILKGWTAIGFGRTELPLLNFSFRKDLSDDAQKNIGAIEQALCNLSLKCDPSEAGGALYLISAPKKKIDNTIVEEAEKILKKVAPRADIRGGDYPGEWGRIDVTLIFSQLKDIERVKSFYERYEDYQKEAKARKKDAAQKQDELTKAAEKVPSLFEQ